MAATPKTKAVGGAARVMVLLLVTILLLLLILLAVLSLIRLTGTESTESSPTSPTAVGPAARSVESVPLGGADDATVSCGRQDTGGSTPTSFLIEVTGTTGGAELVVAVDLVAGDGTRRSRSVDVPLDGSASSVLVRVPGSDDSNIVACVVTAIQQDRRLLLTGN